ncbi:unnamed protein product [Mytilus coruscus]|uniref:CBM20 domain-containing protein n=1 Tax=Mytilus coruscus TaxID=42192 RepID=A0A6J8CYW1_MYTCO|nr:unnamed protein product [Mytilus coruscus]
MTENVSFVFETRYITQNVNQRLAISGSLEILGNWSVETAVIAEETPVNSGRWRANVEIPRNTSSRVYRWEERPNRSLSSGTSPAHVRSAWNLGEEVDIPLKYKFRRKGTINSCSEDEEEWSYIPSEEILQRLCKANDSVKDNATTYNSPQNGNLNCFSGNQSEDNEKLLESEEKNDQNLIMNDSLNPINEQTNLNTYIDERVKEETSEVFDPSTKSLLTRVTEWFCTIL